MDHLCILVSILPLSTVAKQLFCNDSEITECEMIDTKKLIYCICSNISIDYVIVCGLEQGGSLITPMALAHPPHPVKGGRGISAKPCGLDDVFLPDDLRSSPYTQCIIIYIPWGIPCIATF